MDALSSGDHKTNSYSSRSAPQPQPNSTNMGPVPARGSELNAVRALGESVPQDWATSQDLCRKLCPRCLACQDAAVDDRSHFDIIKLEQLQTSDCEFCDVLCRAIHWSNIARDSGDVVYLWAGKASLQIAIKGCSDGLSPVVLLEREPGASRLALLIKVRTLLTCVLLKRGTLSLGNSLTRTPRPAVTWEPRDHPSDLQMDLSMQTNA